MKKDIHPTYQECSFVCASCGNTVQTRSTRGGKIQMDVCSSCHPFFTGKHKLVDTAGRVERFMRKYGISNQEQAT